MKFRLERWLAAGMGGVTLLCAPGAQPQTEAPPDPLRVLWQRPVPGVVGLGIAPDGSRVVAVDRAGRLRCFSEEGQLLWTAETPGVDRVLVGPPGAAVFAYAARQPLRTVVSRFAPDGDVLPPLEADDPITTAAVSDDGRQVLVGTTTGARWFRETARGTTRAAYPLATAVRQLYFGLAGTFVAAVAGPESVRCVQRDGRERWRARGPAAEDCLVSVTPGGVVASVGPAFTAAEAITLVLRRPDGVVIAETSWPGRLPRARIVPSGAAVLVSYEQPESLGATVHYERRLACFPADSSAPPRWTTGGAYTGAALFAATDADGRFTVSLDTELRSGQTSLRLLGDTGQRLLTFPCPSPVRIATAAANGSRVVLSLAGGQLALIRVL